MKRQETAWKGEDQQPVGKTGSILDLDPGNLSLSLSQSMILVLVTSSFRNYRVIRYRLWSTSQASFEDDQVR